MRTGQVLKLEIRAVVPVGDDVTIAEQPFEPFEVHKKQARVEPPENGKQRFVFNLELLALETGDKPIPPIELRVVTKQNFVGTVKTASVPYKVRSLVANEPNAQPKRETKPVVVLQDNYVPIYIAAGLLGAALIAGLTLLIARWLRARKVAAIPPPPPRPPWEIAVEKLAELRRQKQPMLDAGQGGAVRRSTERCGARVSRWPLRVRRPRDHQRRNVDAAERARRAARLHARGRPVPRSL